MTIKGYSYDSESTCDVPTYIGAKIFYVYNSNVHFYTLAKTLCSNLGESLIYLIVEFSVPLGESVYLTVEFSVALGESFVPIYNYLEGTISISDN